MSSKVWLRISIIAAVTSLGALGVEFYAEHQEKKFRKKLKAEMKAKDYNEDDDIIDTESIDEREKNITEYASKVTDYVIIKNYAFTVATCASYIAAFTGMLGWRRATLDATRDLKAAECISRSRADLLEGEYVISSQYIQPDKWLDYQKDLSFLASTKLGAGGKMKYTPSASQNDVIERAIQFLHSFA